MTKEEMQRIHSHTMRNLETIVDSSFESDL